MTNQDQPSSAGGVIDARTLIEGDLDRLRARRRRHFLPALILVIIGLGGSFVLGGARPDLFAQPPWQLAIQLTLWGLCLLVFPAIGLGLLFPGRAARIGLAISGVILTVVATLGWPAASGGGVHIDSCLVMLVIFGIGLLALGLFSGAFVQRRRPSAIYWVAAGVTLAALSTVTWHCPKTGAEHVMPNHLGGALALMLLACVVGFVAHRRRPAT